MDFFKRVKVGRLTLVAQSYGVTLEKDTSWIYEPTNEPDPPMVKLDQLPELIFTLVQLERELQDKPIDATNGIRYRIRSDSEYWPNTLDVAVMGDGIMISDFEGDTFYIPCDDCVEVRQQLTYLGNLITEHNKKSK